MKEKKLIAIDIVLIPDNIISNICKEINISCNSKIDFNNTKKVPHISLLMGVVDFSRINEIKNIIKSFYVGNLVFTGEVGEYFLKETGEKLLSLNIEKNLELEILFSKLKSIIGPFLNYDKINRNMFFEGKEIEEVFLDYVMGYSKNNIFSAHITLGVECGEKYIGESFTFSSNKIELFQLGNYCTCSNNL